MIDCGDFGGPHWSPDLFGPDRRGGGCGRLTRFCKGGGDSSGAIREQRLAREQSARQFAEQMAYMREQAAAAANIKTPVYAPPAPVASGGEDAWAARMEARRRAARRFGSMATVLTGPGRGGMPVAGGAVAVA